MPPEELPRRSAARWALPAALSAGGVLAIVVVMSRPSVVPAPAAAVTRPPAAAAPPAVVAAPPAAPVAALPPPAPTSVAIEVRGLPAGGGLLLDGAPAAPPLKLRRDGRRHLVIARAPGFYDRAIELEADRDQAVDVVLTAISKGDKPRGHESGGGSHHASASHGTSALPPPQKGAEAPAPAKPPQPPSSGNGKKKTNYDEM
jgi:hypothetical protein